MKRKVLILIFLLFINFNCLGFAIDKEKSIESGGFFTLAISESEALYGFGNNSNHEMGSLSSVNFTRPTKLFLVENVKAMASGRYHALILHKDKSISVWGGNLRGQLGLGDYKDRKEPIKLENFKDVKQVEAGSVYSFSAILLESGELYMAGANYTGQLGHSLTNTQNTFKKVNIPPVEEVAVGGGHVLALLKNGNLVSFGSNYAGQLGNGSQINSSKPVSTGLTNIKSIYAGASHSMAITNNNILYVWGNNRSGQLGLGDNKNRLKPTSLNISDLYDVSLGTEFTLMLKGNGNVYSTGNNDFGELGVGDNKNRNTFTQITSLKNIQEIDAGIFQGFAINKDLEVLSWGSNESNQLGLKDKGIKGVVNKPTLIEGFKVKKPEKNTYEEELNQKFEELKGNYSLEIKNKLWDEIYNINDENLRKMFIIKIFAFDDELKNLYSIMLKAETNKTYELIKEAKKYLETIKQDNLFSQEYQERIENLVDEYNMLQKYGDIEKVTEYYIEKANTYISEYYLNKANYFISLVTNEEKQRQYRESMSNVFKEVYGEKNYILYKRAEKFVNYAEIYNRREFLIEAEKILNNINKNILTKKLKTRIEIIKGSEE